MISCDKYKILESWLVDSYMRSIMFQVSF